MPHLVVHKVPVHDVELVVAHGVQLPQDAGTPRIHTPHTQLTYPNCTALRLGEKKCVRDIVCVRNENVVLNNTHTDLLT